MLVVLYQITLYSGLFIASNVVFIFIYDKVLNSTKTALDSHVINVDN